MKYYYTTSIRCRFDGPLTMDETRHEVEKRTDVIRHLKNRNWVLLNIVEITKEEYEEIGEIARKYNDQTY